VFYYCNEHTIQWPDVTCKSRGKYWIRRVYLLEQGNYSQTFLQHFKLMSRSTQTGAGVHHTVLESVLLYNLTKSKDQFYPTELTLMKVLLY
jgi:hypothetical protein